MMTRKQEDLFQQMEINRLRQEREAKEKSEKIYSFWEIEFEDDLIKWLEG